MEIGVLNGENAKTMVEAALQNVAPTAVEYYGFDYFNRSQFNEVQSKLEKTGCTFALFQGDSTSTLPKVLHTLPKMDVIFIDGGKTRAEAFSDWDASKTLIGMNRGLRCQPLTFVIHAVAASPSGWRIVT